ncbi:hypothetical protein AeMF1_018211 [Aphanomyces euteiches]|nr:hypothetical protein AeMF1_018211 [Aphanomyces euteiches]
MNECAQVAVSIGIKIGIRPIRTCIDAKAKQFAAMMHLNKAPDDVSNAEWNKYFEDALNHHGPDYGDLEAKIRSSVTMDERELDPDRCFDKWVYSYWNLLEKNNMMSFHSRHPKNVVKALLEGIRPAALKAVIRSRLELDQKHLRNSVLQFMAYVKTKLVAHLEFVRATKASGIVKIPEDDKQPKKQKSLKNKASAGGSSGDQKPKRMPKCWACGKAHRLKDCVETSEADKKAIAVKKVEEWRAKDGKAEATSKQKALRWPQHEPANGSCWALIPESGIENPIEALVDSGSDAGVIISSGLFDLIEQSSDLDLAVDDLKTPQLMEGFGKVPIELSKHVVLPQIVLWIGETSIMLRAVNAWVDHTDQSISATIGRPIMEVLGYSTVELLRNAALSKKEFDVGNLSVLDNVGSAVSRALPIRRARIAAESSEVESDDEDDDADLSVDECLALKLQEAQDKGLSEDGTARLKEMLVKFRDVFRVSFQHDPPVDVEPLEVRFKPDAIPSTCEARRYSPIQTEFLRKHLADIVDAKLGQRSNRSRWSSPPRIVPKKDGTLRMTVDTRGPNSQTEPMHWPMPVLEVVMARLAGKKCFFALDWFKGYWQLPLHPNSREAYTIMGVDEMVEPNRVLMGQTDAVAYCQSVAQTVYGEKYGHSIEAWLDDALGSASHESELLVLLNWLLQRCLKFGLKLNPMKCEFFTTKVVWCGKHISADGIGHDPLRLAGLRDLGTPSSAQDLQQFVGALNWMRQSIPKFSELVAPLASLLEEIYNAVGTRKKDRLTRYLLVDHGWQSIHDVAFASCKTDRLGFFGDIGPSRS